MRKFKDGEMVRVVANLNEHEFPVGSVVELVGRYGRNAWKAFGRCNPPYGIREFAITEDEIEHLGGAR